MVGLGSQSDSAQPLLYNIYKLEKWAYKPDTRLPYEVIATKSQRCRGAAQEEKKEFIF